MGSDYLFTTPSFVSGVARLVDLLGQLDDYNYAPNSRIADAIAMRVDWQTVGEDLRAALEAYKQQQDCEQLPLFDLQRESAVG